MAKSKIKPCNCVEQMNKALEPFNTILTRGFSLTLTKPRKMELVSPIYLETEKLDSSIRKPKKTVLATFCPFCGKKLPDRE